MAVKKPICNYAGTKEELRLGDTIVGGGATGAPGNYVFMEGDQAVTGNYTLTAGKNAVSAGPISINDGISVTIPDGATWTVV